MSDDDKVPKPSDSGFIREALDRFDESADYQSELRDKAQKDYKFALVPGHQWDQHLTSKRRRRPCYEFNRLRQMIRRITGQQLQNRPQIKVRPAEDGDVAIAEIYNGLIRGIETTLDAELAYDHGFTWAVTGGKGAWELTTEYEYDPQDEYAKPKEKRDGKLFNKRIVLKPIDDPFTVTFDATSRDFYKRDARYCFVSQLLPRSTFKQRYPGKQIVDFATSSKSLYKNWWYEDTVRVAKYWYKETEKRVIYLLSDDSVVDAVDFDPIAPEAAQDGITIKELREVDRDIIKCCLISGAERLTEPVEWPGKYFPIIINWGDVMMVEGDQYYTGMTRFGRDAQMIHNFELSTLIEVVAKLPNSPLTATPKMIEGLKSYYERMGYDDPPVLLYNPDPASPNARPTREPSANFPAAFANVSAIAIDEIKATTGVYDASLGAQSNETSGRAILARQQEADISNYVFIDNHLKARKFTGEILIDLIPKVYDATRMIRILGEDGAEKFVKVNERVPVTDKARQLMANGKPTEEQIDALIRSGDIKVLYDLSRGRYDLVVTTGKSFETQRMEVAEAAEAMARTPGPFGLLAQYLLFKNLDVPGMDEFLQACRKVLVGQGLLEPGEKDKPPAPPPPDPKVIADVELKGAQARNYDAKTQQIAALTPAQVEKTQADTAHTITQVGEKLPTIPIGPSIFGPAPGMPQPAVPSSGVPPQ